MWLVEAQEGGSLSIWTFFFSFYSLHLSISISLSTMSTESQPEAGPSIPPPEPKMIVYCQICSFPPEYCEFGSSSTKCRNWLQENHKDLYDSIWSQEAIEENIKNMSVKQAQDLEKDAVKKEKKQEAKAEKDKKEKQVSGRHTTSVD